MEKKCKCCGSIYIDHTKRKVGKTCSKICASKLMVQARHANGSFVRTDIQNEKMIASMKQARIEGRWSISPEAKLRLSIKMKSAHIDGQIQSGQHMKLPEHRERNSKLHTGRIVSVETRKKLSKRAQKQIHRFSRCRGGFRDDLKTYFRSSWEANYARYLNHLNISWKYESFTFDLGEGLTYTPDFELEDGTFVEIKGWLTEKGALKLNKFKSTHPDVKIIVVSVIDYRKLYREYEKIIPNWEKVAT